MAKYRWKPTPQALRNITILLVLLIIIIVSIANAISKGIKTSLAKRQYKTLTKELQVTIDAYHAQGLSYPSGVMIQASTTPLPPSVSEYLWLYSNRAMFADTVVSAAQNNISYTHFLYTYGQGNYKPGDGKLTEAELSGGVPTYYQWDERWAYQEFGDNILGICGSGPPAMSMAIVGLSHDASATPGAIAAYAEDEGLYYEGYGSAWALVPYAADEWGLNSYEVILDQNAMESALDDDEIIVVVVGKGDFTKDSTGFLVLYDYNEEGFFVKDPLNETNTEKRISYKSLEDEIEAMWAIYK